MGNYFGRQPQANYPATKCNDARTKITQAREKYLKNLLEEDFQNIQTGDQDEVDGTVETINSKLFFFICKNNI